MDAVVVDVWNRSTSKSDAIVDVLVQEARHNPLCVWKTARGSESVVMSQTIKRNPRWTQDSLLAQKVCKEVAATLS